MKVNFGDILLNMSFACFKIAHCTVLLLHDFTVKFYKTCHLIVSRWHSIVATWFTLLNSSLTLISGQVFENSQFVYPPSEIVCLSVLIIVEINLWEPTLNDLRVKLLNAVQRGGLPL